MSLLLSVLDHYLGVTKNRAHGRLKLLANVCEKQSVKSVVLVVRRRRLHNHSSFSWTAPLLRINAWLSVDAFDHSGIKFPCPLGAAEELFLRKPPRGFLIDTIMLRSSKPPGRMSEMGHKRTFPHVRAMSALPPKADIGTQSWDARRSQEVG